MRSKNPTGFSENDVMSTGMTGQSSGRVMWWMPNTCHSTMSASAIGRSAFVHSGSPVSRRLWLQNSPAGQRSSSA